MCTGSKDSTRFVRYLYKLSEMKEYLRIMSVCQHNL
jgi:hypothetical protein